MITVSDDFHQAVKNGEPQRALLRFSHETLGNDDISVTSKGVQLTEIINGEENLRFGLCSSASLNVSLINEGGVLEKFDFGEFTALLGVRTEVTKYNLDAVCAVVIGDHVITGHKDSPHIRVNGEYANYDTTYEPLCFVAQNNVLYVFGNFGNNNIATRFNYSANNGFVFTGLGGATANFTDIQRRKINRMMQDHIGIHVVDDSTIAYCKNGANEKYEFAPLGVFIAPRPNVLRKSVVDVEANDRMQLFDSDLSDVSFTYPLTLESALDSLCSAVGVNRVEQEIPNASLSISKKPDLFDGATKRDVLSWIAEASATFARFNRVGQLELVRFADTGIEYTEQDYVSVSPYTYKVPQIDKLHIRNANSSDEEILGSGENGYLIQDNPFLKPNASLYVQSRSSEPSSPSDTILSALSDVGTFNPVAADTFADWTMQAGDVVTFKSGTESYKTPVYTMRMTWKGSPRVSMESTGEEKPAPIPLFQRRSFGGGRGLARAEKEAEEFRAWATIQIDEQKGDLQLLTGSVNDLTGEFANAVIRLNGVEGLIELKADASDVDGKFSEAWVAINGKASQIDLNAEKVRINALETEILGLVTLEEFESVKGWSEYFAGTLIEATELDVDNASIEHLEGVATLDAGEITCGGITADEVDVSSGGSITIPADATLSLFGYNPRWNQMGVVKNASLTTSKRYLNLMLADGTTTGYIDIVTGATLNTTTDTITYLYRGS